MNMCGGCNLPDVDMNLRRALTLRILAGAQEAAPFGLYVTVVAEGRLPFGLALENARVQLGRINYSFGAFSLGPFANPDGQPLFRGVFSAVEYNVVTSDVDCGPSTTSSGA